MHDTAPRPSRYHYCNAECGYCRVTARLKARGVLPTGEPAAPAKPASWPTPPVIGTRIRLQPFRAAPAGYESGHEDVTVTGFDAEDGAVFTDTGEIVANHLDGYRRFVELR